MEYRRMRLDDVDEYLGVGDRAFKVLGEQRRAFDPFEWHQPAPGQARVRYEVLLGSDPDGAWLAIGDDGRMAGGSVAIVREGVWGLSHLVVDPDAQSSGVGRELLRLALEYGDGGPNGAVVVASSDSRALRAYAREGFELHPGLKAAGPPRLDRRPAGLPGIRPFEPGDEQLLDDLGRRMRGAGYGSDADGMRRMGRVDVVPGRGFVQHEGGGCKLLLAADPEAARALLWQAIAGTPEGGHAQIPFLNGFQQWALPVLLDAGLRLIPEGGLMLRGIRGDLQPWIPSGTFL